MRADGTSPEYDEQVIKRYKHWILFVSGKQYYLGRATSWLVRPGEMQRISSLTEEERSELWDVVLPAYEAALERLWKPAHMNYAWLGNYFHVHKGHGHLHMIPRYKEPREFQGWKFVDERWGENYAPVPQVDIPKDIILAVRDALKAELG